MTPTTRDGERPVEQRLRQALDARAAGVTVRALRPADPPGPHLRRLPVTVTWLRTAGLGAVAAAALVGYLVLTPDPPPVRPAPPAAPPEITTPPPSPTPSEQVESPSPVPGSPALPSRAPSASASTSAPPSVSASAAPKSSTPSPFPPPNPNPSSPPR